MSGTFDGKVFQLRFKMTGGNYPVYGVSGLAVLEWPTVKTVELTRDSVGDSAAGPVVFAGKGNVGGSATMSANGRAYLSCCFSDSGPTTPAKRQPQYLGDGD